MALFELTEDRLVPTTVGRPAEPEQVEAVLAAARRHLVEVLGRPLLVVETEPVDGGHAVTALDPSGQVVLIAVLDRLGSASLLSLMARSSAHRSSGPADLAQHYPGGASAFAASLAEFRDAVPVRSEPGPVLTVLTAEVAPDVRAAIAMLRVSGVELHLLRPRVLEDGRLLISLDPLGATALVASAPLLVDRGQGAGRRSPAPAHEPEAVTAPTPAPAPALQGDVGRSHRAQAAPLGAEPTVPTGEASREALALIASRLGEPTRLVWRRPRRGIDHEALLSPDGSLVLADGRVFHDPSDAACAAQRTQDVDGWRAWRVGERGPALSELLAG